MPEFEEKRKVKIEWFDNDIWNGKTGFVVYEDPEDSSETSTVTVRITDFPTEDGFQEVDQNFEKRFVKPYEEAEKDIEFSEEAIEEEPVDEIPSEEEKVFKEETVQEESLKEALFQNQLVWGWGEDGDEDDSRPHINHFTTKEKLLKKLLKLADCSESDLNSDDDVSDILKDEYNKNSWSELTFDEKLDYVLQLFDDWGDGSPFIYQVIVDGKEIDHESIYGLPEDDDDDDDDDGEWMTDSLKREESLNEELAEDYFIRIERQGNTMWIVKVHDAHSYEEAESKALKAIHIDDDIDEISREEAESEIEDGQVILIDETGTEISLDESLKESEEPEAECCICHKHFKGYGNNPYPVAEEGRCCDECNATIVIPARINQLGKGVPSDIDFDDEEFEDCEDCREYSEIPDDLD